MCPPVGQPGSIDEPDVLTYHHSPLPADGPLLLHSLGACLRLLKPEETRTAPAKACVFDTVRQNQIELMRTHACRATTCFPKAGLACSPRPKLLCLPHPSSSSATHTEATAARRRIQTTHTSLRPPQLCLPNAASDGKHGSTPSSGTRKRWWALVGCVVVVASESQRAAASSSLNSACHSHHMRAELLFQEAVLGAPTASTSVARCLAFGWLLRLACLVRRSSSVCLVCERHPFSSMMALGSPLIDRSPFSTKASLGILG